MDLNNLKNITKSLRLDIVKTTTLAQSGHLTSSLSSVELMTVLFFTDFFKLDKKDPKNINNDKIIFSKGHASPLLYSLYKKIGLLSEDDLKTYRKFGSKLEGHPTPNFELVDVATGSLGQGLSIVIGMAMSAKFKNILDTKYYCLIGDSETSEGQFWEALQIASFYKLNNVIGIIDVNRLGQRGETINGWDIEKYETQISSFGWKCFVIEDGHDMNEIFEIYKKVQDYSKSKNSKPVTIIAKTIKGKGISFLENKNNWHGKALTEEQAKQGILEIENSK